MIDPVRERQIEDRARRARPGPCLRCGKRAELVPGRVGGFSVYCKPCALAEIRQPATIGERR